MLLAATNCVEPYDFVPGEAGDFLVVSGVITQMDEINRIKISRSTAFGTNAAEDPVESAEITLFDASGNSELFINEGSGYYAHYGNIIKPVTGGSYYIEIGYGTKKYQTSPQVMPDPVVPDSVTISVGWATQLNSLGEEVTYENIDVFVNTPINLGGETSHLRWSVDESWSFAERQCHPLHITKSCYMTGRINDNIIYLFSGESIEGNYLAKKKVVGKRLSDRVEFIEKHFINVNQYTLSDDAYAYWEKARQLSYPEGSIFDLPPAPLPGNVYNVADPDELVLGYVEVSAKAISRIGIYQSYLAPFTVPSKDYICYFGDYTNACCECLTIRNSSTNKPDYWD
jgi:hypothetical protein